MKRPIKQFDKAVDEMIEYINAFNFMPPHQNCLVHMQGTSYDTPITTSLIKIAQRSFDHQKIIKAVRTSCLDGSLQEPT